MDREKMVQEVKKAIDNFRMEEEEKINGNWYVNSSYLCAELSNGDVIDKVVEKFIPEGSVVLTREEYSDLKNEIVNQFYKIQNAREETEKEVLQEIWDKATEYDEYYDTEDETEYANIEWVGLSRDDFLKICKERGVEVE